MVVENLSMQLHTVGVKSVRLLEMYAEENHLEKLLLVLLMILEMI